MRKNYLPLLLFVLLAFPQVAFAHPGHFLPHSFGGGFLHPFTGLDHILAMVAVGLWAVQLRGKALWALPLSFVSLMVAGGLLSKAGLTLPMVEPMIAASILVLGLLVTLSTRVSLRIGTLLVGFFALFHGYAHIAEIGSHGLLTYVLGFSLATAILHGAGIAFGLTTRGFSEKVIRLAGASTLAIGILMILGG
jgi:urease accessory protein